MLRAPKWLAAALFGTQFGASKQRRDKWTPYSTSYSFVAVRVVCGAQQRMGVAAIAMGKRLLLAPLQRGDYQWNKRQVGTSAFTHVRCIDCTEHIGPEAWGVEWSRQARRLFDLNVKLLSTLHSPPCRTCSGVEPEPAGWWRILTTPTTNCSNFCGQSSASAVTLLEQRD